MSDQTSEDDERFPHAKAFYCAAYRFIRPRSRGAGPAGWIHRRCIGYADGSHL